MNDTIIAEDYQISDEGFINKPLLSIKMNTNFMKKTENAADDAGRN